MEDVEDIEDEEEAPSSKQKASQQKKMDSHLNWQALNPWDGAGGLNPTDEDSLFGHHKDVEGAPSPRQNYMWTNKEHKKSSSQDWDGQNPLFY
ncbi:hypothetical protein BTVI_134413 [Pitangus sulphuratus]|nr:hypothetical protein BTVI_134413 [Pitangus sulphuratus]